eukprot:1050581-Pleurochrysis_carterae.AAC.2
MLSSPLPRLIRSDGPQRRRWRRPVLRRRNAAAAAEGRDSRGAFSVTACPPVSVDLCSERIPRLEHIRSGTEVAETGEASNRNIYLESAAFAASVY